MGVFKNGVGRPSNETIKKRSIFKVICLLLVLIIIVLAAYIVNDKLKENNKKINISVYEKYKNLNFVRDKNLTANLYDADAEGKTINFNVNNGILYAYFEDDRSIDIAITGIEGKVKYITKYDERTYDGFPVVAVLTEDGNLYQASTTSLNFKKVKSDNKIKDMVVVNESDKDLMIISQLYVLTNDNELVKVEDNYTNNWESTWYVSKNKYEERIVLFGCMEGDCYSGYVKPKDKTVRLYTNYSKRETSDIIKYNSKTIKANKIFINAYYDSNNNETKSDLFIIDEENNIYKTKKSKSIDDLKNTSENYKIELYNNSKVKSIEYKKDDNSLFKYKIIINYVNDKSEVINDICTIKEF